MSRGGVWVILGLIVAGCAGSDEPATEDVPDLPEVQQGMLTPEAPDDTRADAAVPAQAERPPAPSGPPEGAPLDERVGMLGREGSDPMSLLVLTTPEGVRIRVGGPGAPDSPVLAELDRLEGATVRTRGRLAPSAEAWLELETLTVSDYEILSIEGERPTVGRIAAGRSDSGPWLESDEGSSWRLEGLPESAPPGEGARVWILGDRRGDVISVRAFGVLAPSP